MARREERRLVEVTTNVAKRIILTVGESSLWMTPEEAAEVLRLLAAEVKR